MRKLYYIGCINRKHYRLPDATYLVSAKSTKDVIRLADKVHPKKDGWETSIMGVDSLEDDELFCIQESEMFD